ncbi:hypothetical protein [Ilumatobacter sp.]|uniref:hypothetical protein n=1 Tax=Ilumatobacter sp. TaxID=1967498 RepID=UPI003C6265BB
MRLQTCEPARSLGLGETRRRGGRRAVTAVLVVVSLGALAACGGSDTGSESSQEAFCDAGDRLRTDVEGIATLDFLSGDTDGLSEQFDAIRSDLDELSESGSDVASEEIDDLQAAVDEFGASVESLTDGFSIDAAGAVADSVGDLVTAASAAFERLSSACS